MDKKDKSLLQKIKERIIPTKTPMSGVYAGPEYFKDKGKKKATVIEDVYGGPEYFDDKENDEPMACVYAGPEYFKQKDENQPIGFVYAGPSYFMNKGVEANNGESLPYPENYQKKEYKFCECCGKKNDASAKFCNECGAPFEAKDITI